MKVNGVLALGIVLATLSSYGADRPRRLPTVIGVDSTDQTRVRTPLVAQSFDAALNRYLEALERPPMEPLA